MRSAAERTADRKAKATMTGMADAYDNLAKEIESTAESQNNTEIGPLGVGQFGKAAVDTFLWISFGLRRAPDDRSRKT
jgi:hypothetical protein